MPVDVKPPQREALSVSGERQRRFTAEEYHAIARAGILGEDDPVELIDGAIVEKRPVGGPHVSCVNRLNRLLFRRVDPEAVVSVQNPVRLDAHQEPEPDLALLRPSRAREDVPRAGEVLLVVEVADTSLDFDRDVKGPRYAASGVPEVWLVALAEDYVEVFRRPERQTYRTVERKRRGQSLSLDAFPQAEELSVEEVLGEDETPS